MERAATPGRARPRKRARSVRSEANIHIRTTIEIKHLIETAANAVGKTLSDFVLDSARRRAVDVLLNQRHFTLDPHKYDAFISVLDSPPPAEARLKALLKRKPLWQR